MLQLSVSFMNLLLLKKFFEKMDQFFKEVFQYEVIRECMKNISINKKYPVCRPLEGVLGILCGCVWL